MVLCVTYLRNLIYILLSLLDDLDSFCHPRLDDKLSDHIFERFSEVFLC